MVDRIVVVSGAIASGKSELARALCDRFRGKRYSTREMLIEQVGELTERAELQAAGERLDAETDGAWVRDGLSRAVYDLKDLDFVVIDSVRISAQIAHLRRSFGRRVIHVHVDASDDTLRERYESRRAHAEVDELPTYEEARASKTEQQVGSLALEADVVVDSDRSTPADLLVRVARAIGLFDGEPTPCVDVLVGGEFGSEGKGHVAFYLAPEYDLLVRVGGPNAGHTVYLPSGETYTHHQLPSGTRAGTAKLLIGPGAVLNAQKLLQEISECGVDPDRLTIDPRAMIIAPEDIALEEEGKLKGEHGSTAQGVGFATARRVLRDGFPDFVPVQLAGDVADLKPFTERTAVDVLEDAYAAGKRVFLEGTQGTGLSLFHGPYPKVTSRETGAAGTAGEAGIAPRRIRRVILVCRTHPIRVENPPGGSSGPLQHELEWHEVEDRAGFERDVLKNREFTSTTDRQRRVGEFEWTLLRSSALINGPTDIALTFVDYICRDNVKARRFEQLTEETIYFVEEVERVAGAPVSLISTRFQHPERSIIDRRSW